MGILRRHWGTWVAGLLALRPNPEPIDIEGSPSVPVDRVRPSGMDVRRVTSIYLSMGMVQPEPRTEV